MHDLHDMNGIHEFNYLEHAYEYRLHVYEISNRYIQNIDIYLNLLAIRILKILL